MGVRGLTTYISENSDVYLKPFELTNTYLVIDGCNLAASLYKWVSKSDCAFGGDYDEYYKTVEEFFLMLMKCFVTPIVILDGGYEKAKIKTTIYRASSKLSILETFNREFFINNKCFPPLFIRETFLEVMETLGVISVQCDFEADLEIASVARVLGCPVLSNDSDFYIYDVLFIPISSIDLEVLKAENSGKNCEYYMKCSIYDVDNFLEKLGLEKSLLPIAAALLGNDYADGSIFQKFFNHVILPKSKNMSYTQKKIHGVFNWLKKETVESSTKLIISHLENKHNEIALKIINDNIKNYTESSLSESVILKINRLTITKANDGSDLVKKNFPVEFPLLMKQLYQEGKISRSVMSMITLRVYFTSVQIEDLDNESCHMPSMDLIKAIDIMVNPCAGDKSRRPLKVYLIKNHKYQYLKINNENSVPVLANCNLSNVLLEPKQFRIKLLYEIAKMDDNDIEVISSFSNNWSIFLLAFIYWVKILNDKVSVPHALALFLMLISNQVVQKTVGYYRNNSAFMKKKQAMFLKLKDTNLNIENESEQNFDKLLANVTLYECLLLQKVLIPIRTSERKKSESETGRTYCISTIHLFNSFQSCLYHLIQINSLLNYPLPHIKISDFYSGTILFNFYSSIKQKPNFEKFGESLLKDTPNLGRIYNFICEKLSGYVNVNVKIYTVKRKKSRKSKKGRKQHWKKLH